MSEPDPIYYDESQLALMSQEEIGGVIFSEDERRGIYTSDRLRNAQPKLYELVVHLLSDPGISYRAITKATGCHHNTLKAVEAKDLKLIAAEKERVSGSYRQIRNMCAEAIIEALPRVPVKSTTDLQKLAIVAAVATDKAELLTGNATQRVARVNEERLEDLSDHFSKLSEAIDAEFTAVTSFDGETRAAKGDAAAERPPSGNTNPGPESPTSGPGNAF